MGIRNINVRLPRASVAYDIQIGGRLEDVGRSVRQWAAKAKRAAVVSNETVFPLYGERVVKSLQEQGFDVSDHIVHDGESVKNLREAERLTAAFSAAGISRTDCVVALGGGVVGDLAGFTAAIHLRGVPLIQAPTTLLAMIDSSVGGKTGVNSRHGKNLIGAFHQPRGVFIDPSTLRTLEPRELTAGFCEAIKHGAVSGARLLRRTAAFLQHHPAREGFEADADANELIAEHVRFKARVVRADEQESAENTGAMSRKILNFGHTLAHALEKVTNYRRFKHGEAVGHGIRFATYLSNSLDLLSDDDVELLNDVVRRAGRLPGLAGIDRERVLHAFSSDKKNVGGSLQFVLLNGIGRPILIDRRDIPDELIVAAYERLLD
jgi:3-dehydroquinate synthase